MRKILVTSALPYANGQIHIGHLLEYIQTDIWVRYQRLRGHECLYFCGDDTHGTAIMISAQKARISPEAFIEQVRKDHMEDFSKFQIEFTNFSSTHSPENRELCTQVFQKMKDKGHIGSKMVDQAYCNHDKMFLPDRYVKGTCPKCKTPDQYGDSCDKCGATYNANELLQAYCSVCKNTPVMKSSEHLVFKLNNFKDFLKDWVPAHNDKDISKKLLEWFKEDLRDWDISRDAPYFGFEIPGYKDKYFYVWVDAPIGYIASSWEWAKKHGRSYEEFWKKDSDYEIYHFIGKDIVYFHSLFWPAMLKTADLKTPTKVCVHGMLMVNGEKMSKSKGTFINAKTYLKYLDPMYLRYYYACKLSSAVEDIDLSLEDFVSRVNSDLVGKITNLASRGAQMLTKKMDSKVGKVDAEGKKLLDKARAKSEAIAAYYESRDYSKVIVEIRGLAEEGNRYFDEKVPWNLLKEDPEKARVVLTNTLNFFKILAIYLKPVIPDYVKRVEEILNLPTLTWKDIDSNFENQKINDYIHIATRIEEEKVKKMVDDSKQSLNTAAPSAESFISIDDFMKIDLRVAKIVNAEAIPEADKLLKIEVQVGEARKTVFAGIKAKYTPESLVGKHVILVNNLQPRKMKFGLSEGMLLAASDSSSGPFLLTVDEGAKDGSKVK